MHLSFIPMVLREALVRAFLWTLVHSLWQGVLLAVGAAVVILLTRRKTPVLRYNLLLGCFALFVAGVAVTFVAEIWTQRGFVRESDTIVRWADSGVATVLQGEEVRVPASDVRLPGDVAAFLDRHAMAIVGLWAVALLIKCIQLFLELRMTRRLRYRGVRMAEEAWQKRLQALAQQLRVNRAVRLLESSLAAAPMMMGLLKPVILLPLGLLSQLPPQEVEAILLHELAHVRRRDYLVNLLQGIVEALFFFHPAIWWISAQLRREREHCCDDVAVGEMRSGKDYVRALVSFVEFRQRYALSFAANRHHLLDRVRRIVDKENRTLHVREKLVLSMSVLAVTVLLMGYRNGGVIGPTGAMALKLDTTRPAEKDSVVVDSVADVTLDGELSEIAEQHAVRDTVILPDMNKREATRRRLQQEKARLEQRLAEIQVREIELQDVRSMQEKEIARNQVRIAGLKSLQDKDEADKMAKLRDLQAMGMMENQLRLAKIEEEQLRLTEVKLDRGGSFSMSAYVDPVLDLLLQKGLITQTDDVSFSLNKDELSVNDKKMSKEVSREFIDKFIEDPKDLILYSKKAGSASITVNKHSK